MSRQLTFCATPADSLKLETRLQQLEPMRVLHNRSSSSDPRVVPSLDFSESGVRWLSFFLVRVDDLSHVVTTHVPAQGYWTIDELRSPVVQCRLTFFEKAFMRAGRLHYVDGFYGDRDEWIEKPEPFRQWANAVLKTARNSLAKYEDIYIGAAAREWLERNDAVIER